MENTDTKSKIPTSLPSTFFDDKSNLSNLVSNLEGCLRLDVKYSPGMGKFVPCDEVDVFYVEHNGETLYTNIPNGYAGKINKVSIGQLDGGYSLQIGILFRTDPEASESNSY